MSNRFETLEITCPKCNKSHTYRLEIHRSIVLYHRRASTKTREHTFTRIFICPSTGKKFQACIAIAEQAGEILHDVVGVIYSGEDQKQNEEE